MCVWLFFCLVFGVYGDFECVEFGFDGFLNGGCDVGGVGSEGFAERFDGGGLGGDCGCHVAYSLVDVADACVDVAFCAVFDAAIVGACEDAV